MLRSGNHSLANKLTYINMLVSGACLLLASLAFVAYDELTYKQTMVKALSSEAQIVGFNSASAVVFDDPDSARTTLSAVKSLPDIVAAIIVVDEGRRFADYHREGISEDSALRFHLPPAEMEAHWFGAGRLVLARAIVFKGKNLGVVYLESDLAALRTRRQEYLTYASLVLLGCLLTSLFVSSRFRRAFLEPIVALADLARAISRDKNFALRAPPPAEHNEVAVLVHAFNDMLGEIQDRDSALLEARSELERKVEERTADLTAANKELETFSYSVSHDLRAPLRSIDGFSAALMEDCEKKLEPADLDSIRRIRANTTRMACLIDDMLKLARVTRAEMAVDRVDLSGLVQDISGQLQANEPNRRAKFVITPGLAVKGDAILLRTVLENLIGNAWKFTSKRVDSCIEFGVIGEGSEIIYYVRDNGSGFDMEYAGKLFGIFQRLHRDSEFPGTGVGLATVQRIIRRHGGRIWAESVIDQGATFYFALHPSRNIEVNKPAAYAAHSL